MRRSIRAMGYTSALACSVAIAGCGTMGSQRTADGFSSHTGADATSQRNVKNSNVARLGPGDYGFTFDAIHLTELTVTDAVNGSRTRYAFVDPLGSAQYGGKSLDSDVILDRMMVPDTDRRTVRSTDGSTTVSPKDKQYVMVNIAKEWGVFQVNMGDSLMDSAPVLARNDPRYKASVSVTTDSRGIVATRLYEMWHQNENAFTVDGRTFIQIDKKNPFDNREGNPDLPDVALLEVPLDPADFDGRAITDVVNGRAIDTIVGVGPLYVPVPVTYGHAAIGNTGSNTLDTDEDTEDGLNKDEASNPQQHPFQ
jgi:hypothetical protein